MGHVYGRLPVAERLEALVRFHFHDGSALRTVDHEPAVAVLEQENFAAQGIDTSKVVPGAPTVDALGNCTANAFTAALSNLLPAKTFLEVTGCKTLQDAVAAECFAIRFYASETALMGQPWPPTDGGCSGPYIVDEAEQQGWVTTDKIAHGAENIVSLMQQGGLLAGIPYLLAWEEPGGDGFVDGDGSYATLQRQVAQGVAGGHEIYLSAIERLRITASGQVDATETIVRFRNSWGASWGDAGSGRFHLSTLVALGNAADFRLPVAA